MQFAHRAAGSSGPRILRLVIILTVGNVLQANLRSMMAKIYCSLRSQGASFSQVCSGPPKLLGGPCFGGGIGNRALLNESQKLEEKSVMNFIHQTLFLFQINASIEDNKNHERMLS